MREERLDLEGQLKICKSKIDAAVKEIENLHTKAKNYNQVVENIEKKLETFEMNKLKNLNDLDIFMYFRAEQVKE